MVDKVNGISFNANTPKTGAVKQETNAFGSIWDSEKIKI